MEQYIASATRYAGGDKLYCRCGNSGVMLPKVSLGFWQNFGAEASYDNCRTIARMAFDNGITHFDLANNYGPPPGFAEEMVGRMLKDDFHSHRDELLIATKAGYDMWQGPYGDGGSRKYLISSIDQSLKRLNLSYVDIFYHHRMDKETPLEETMLALSDIVKSGKALYVGLSNYDGETMVKASKILRELNCPFIINQNRCSILDRTIDNNGLLESAINENKGVITFCPLEQGLLTGKYIDGIPEDSRIKTDGRFLKERSLTAEKMEKIRKLNDLASARGQTLSQMAIAYLLGKKGVTSVLMGASKKEQILENIKALDNLNFDREELEKIDFIVL